MFRVVIAGGGTAGWMAAAYLRRAFGERIAVTLIESPKIGTIGVGEATFSTLKLFFDFLELRESDWMPKVNGSYKLAIRFRDWTKDRVHFYHPFERLPHVGGASLAEWWLSNGQSTPFDYACFVTPHLCDAQRSPRYLDGRLLQQELKDHASQGQINPHGCLETHMVQTPYGYHFDAGLVAGLLRDYAVQRGARHVADEIVEVEQGEDGSIDALVTQAHGRIEGDLFIDCTGFRALLMREVMKEPFTSFGESLFCDSAVAMQVPSQPEKNGIFPYTTAHAQDAGWIWRIPLFHRDGSGYVYSGKHIDPDQAEATLRRYHGANADGVEARHIKMKVGRFERGWVKNCVAVGLSASFVEPLESTTIFFIQLAIEELVACFPHDKAGDDTLRGRFNRVMGDCVDGVRDFLVLHYFGSDRDDTEFWRDVQSKMVVPDALRASLDTWRITPPAPRTIYPAYHGFESYSWATIMLGLKKLVGGPPPRVRLLDSAPARAEFERVRQDAARAVAELPSVYEYLSKMHRGELLAD